MIPQAKYGLPMMYGQNPMMGGAPKMYDQPTFVMDDIGTSQWIPKSQFLKDQQQFQQQQGQSNFFGNLFNQFQTAYDEGKAANLARYKQIKTGYQDRYDRGMKMLDGFGEQMGTDINNRSLQATGKAQQSLMNRGLGNTTVVDSVNRGIEADRSAEQRRLGEQITGMRMGADAQLAGDKLQFMERRTDTYPSQEFLAQLAMQMGEAGYGPWGMGEGVTGKHAAQPMQYNFNPSTQKTTVDGKYTQPMGTWYTNMSY